jgi:hypothetical protein
MKEMKYEEYLKFYFKRSILNIIGSIFLLKYFYLKITIILKLKNFNNNASSYLNLTIFNNINNLKKNCSKKKIKNSSTFESICSLGHSSNKKSKSKDKKGIIINNFNLLQKKKNTSRNILISNIKSNYSYKPPFKVLYNNGLNKNKYNCFNLFITPYKKKYNDNAYNKTDTKYEKYISHSNYKTINKSYENNCQLSNCLSERRIGKRMNSQKKWMVKNNSVKNNLFDSYNIKYILKKEKSKKNKNNNKNDKNIKDNFQKNENEN